MSAVVDLVVVVANTNWHDPLVVVTLLVVVATFVLAVVTAVMAWLTHRSVVAADAAQQALKDSADAARLAAEASARQAAGTEDLVKITRRESRPFLIYSGQPIQVEPVAGSSHMRCDVTLRNYGGFAIVDEGTVLGFGVTMRAAPDLAWNGSAIETRLVPPDRETEIRGSTSTRPQADPATSSPPAIYVRVKYTDQHGEQPMVTYLCLWQTGAENEPGWQVVGQAIDTGDGRPMRTGDGWVGFVPDGGVASWPLHGQPWPA